MKKSVYMVVVLFVLSLPVRMSAGPEREPPARGFTLVADDDCGNPGQQPHLAVGGNWAIPEAEREALKITDTRLLTCAHGIQQGARVVFRYVGLRPAARYIARIHYFNMAYDRAVGVEADGENLDVARELPMQQQVTRTLTLPPSIYRDAVVSLSFFHTTGPSALVSAIELWSDTPGLMEPVGSFIRFRVDQLPDPAATVNVTGVMKVHHSPWTLSGLKLTPEPVKETGWTPWVDLRGQPGNANGSLILSIPKGAKGITRFSLVQDDSVFMRDFDWNEPDGAKIIVTPDFADLRTFREQERRYYFRTLEQTGGQLYPLARPPLFFGNAWGYTTGGAAEYMVKSFRLMGFNSVVTSEDAAKYETLYGWHSQAGQYGPPGFMPYDEDQARGQFNAYYEKFFGDGKGQGATPGMRIFQLADEPGETALKPADATAGFRRWLAAQGVKPSVFGKSTLDEVEMLMKDPKTPEENKRYYWSRRYQSYITPKRFALAAEAVRKQGPNPDVQSYVALSGHALYFPSKMSLDMFQLAQYPGLMPGISDWMTSGSWNWDSHQAVAFSVAPFNAGARRYGADFGKPPRSFPMMHCVNPSLFRGYTQLGNQCKFISYYNYGPDYEVTEGYWSHSGLGWAVMHLNNQAAQMDDILGPGLMRPSRVALLYSAPQEIWWPQGSFADKRATFLALAHSYYQPELVTEEQVLEGALAHYDALLVLEQYVSRTVQDRIGEWVKGGGLLWACADALVCDEYKEPYDLLQQLTGLKRDHSKPLGVSVQLLPVEGETAIKEHEVPPQGRSKETIRPGVFEWPGAAIRATYSDQHPAMGMKPAGKGRVVYLGHRAGLAYSRRAGARGAFKWWPDSGQREVLYVPLKEAGVGQDLVVSGPLVMASALSTEAGTVVILYNMHAEAQTNLVVSLKEPDRPHSVQWCGWDRRLVDLPYAYTNGCVEMSGFNLPGSGAMIVVRRTPAPADDRLNIMQRNAERDLGSDDWQAMSAGAWFAGFFADWNLGDRLIPLLTHEHWAVRRSAAESLGRLEFKPALKALQAALDKETDSHALVDQLDALSRLDPKEAARRARRCAEHPDWFVRNEAKRIAARLDKR